MKHSKEVLKDSNTSSVIRYKLHDYINANTCNYSSDEEVEEEIGNHLIIDLKDEDNIENNYQDENKNVEYSKSMKSKLNTANNDSKMHKNKDLKPVENNGHFQQKYSDSKVFYVVDNQKNILKIDLIRRTYEIVYIDKKEDTKLKKISDSSLSPTLNTQRSQQLKQPAALNAKSNINKNNLIIVPGIKANEQPINESNGSFGSTKNVKSIKIPILPLTLKADNLKNLLNTNKSNLVNIQFKKANDSHEILNTTVSTQQSNKKNVLTNLVDTKVDEQQKNFNSNALINSNNCIESSNHAAILKTGNSQNLFGSNETLLLIKPIANHDKSATVNNKKYYCNVNSSKSTPVNPANYFTLNTQTNKLVPIHGFVTAIPSVPTHQLKTEPGLILKSGDLKPKENSHIIFNDNNISLDLKTVRLSKSTCSQEQESKENFREKIHQNKQDLVSTNINTITPIFKPILLPNEKGKLKLSAKKLIINASGVDKKEISDNKTNKVSGVQIDSKQKSITREIILSKNQAPSTTIKEYINEDKQNSDLSVPNRIMIVKNNKISISEEMSLTEAQKKMILDEKNKQLMIIHNNEAGKVSSIDSNPQLALVKLSHVKEYLPKNNNEPLVSGSLRRKISENSEANITKKLKNSKADAPVFECCICKIKLRSIELLNEHYKNHPESKVYFSSKVKERHKLFCSSKEKYYKCKKCIKFSGYPF